MGDSALLDLTAGVACRGIIRPMIGGLELLRTAGGLSQGEREKVCKAGEIRWAVPLEVCSGVEWVAPLEVSVGVESGEV